MRYPASEKLEIICIVEQSHLPVRRPPAKVRATIDYLAERLTESRS
jgi:hypothetical protein